jgi:hypothetical protein
LEGTDDVVELVDAGPQPVHGGLASDQRFGAGEAQSRGEDPIDHVGHELIDRASGPDRFWPLLTDNGTPRLLSAHAWPIQTLRSAARRRYANVRAERVARNAVEGPGWLGPLSPTAPGITAKRWTGMAG